MCYNTASFIWRQVIQTEDQTKTHTSIREVISTAVDNYAMLRKPANPAVLTPSEVYAVAATAARGYYTSQREAPYTSLEEEYAHWLDYGGHLLEEEQNSYIAVRSQRVAEHYIERVWKKETWWGIRQFLTLAQAKSLPVQVTCENGFVCEGFVGEVAGSFCYLNGVVVVLSDIDAVSFKRQ